MVLGPWKAPFLILIFPKGGPGNLFFPPSFCGGFPQLFGKGKAPLWFQKKRGGHFLGPWNGERGAKKGFPRGVPKWAFPKKPGGPQKHNFWFFWCFPPLFFSKKGFPPPMGGENFFQSWAFGAKGSFPKRFFWGPFREGGVLTQRGEEELLFPPGEVSPFPVLGRKTRGSLRRPRWEKKEGGGRNMLVSQP